MANFAFIFARGGSKGLPKKNIKNFMGVPLCTYHSTSNRSPFYYEYLCQRMIQKLLISEKANARVIDRPEQLASDTSPEWLSWQHAICYVQENFGDFQNFISLPTTSPLR